MKSRTLFIHSFTRFTFKKLQLSLKNHGHAFLIFCLAVYVFLPGLVFGQVLPPGQPLPPVFDPTSKSGEPRPLEPQEPLKPPPSQLSPILPSPPTTPEPEREHLPVIRVFIRQIKIIGSTVFTEKDFQPIVEKYLNKELTTEDLQEIRLAITRLYVNKGYINSGAVIPDQTVKDGVLTIRVIEGKLSKIDIEGTVNFFPFYLEQRLRLSAGPPLNINPLRERLQLLLQDSRFKRLNAELQPGLRLGEAALRLRVEEASPYRAWVEFNNFLPPTVGSERGLATVQNQNLLGLGDIFTFTYGQSLGLNPQIETSYNLPLTPWDTTLILQYRRNDYAIVEAPYSVLNITSNTEIFHATLRQPIFKTTSQELALSITGEHLWNQSFINGVGFAFTPGATSNGQSAVSVLRFTQEWIDRSQKQVFSARSRFSVGINVLDATINSNSNLPDSQFFSWLGQAQIAHRFDPYAIEVISHVDLQLTNDRLFPLEEFAVGGRYSVRGYRENTLVRDNAFLWSVESRIPMFPTKLGPNWALQFAPFIDVGRGWYAQGGTTPPTKTLASVGLGLRANIYQRAQFNVYWGVPLNHVSTPGGNLQDHGIHIQLIVGVLG